MLKATMRRFSCKENERKKMKAGGYEIDGRRMGYEDALLYLCSNEFMSVQEAKCFLAHQVKGGAI